MPEEINQKVRPKPDTTKNKQSLLKFLTKDNKSLRQSLALIGVTTLLLGILIWIFLRGLERPALIISTIGLILLIIDGLISLATVRKAIFGRRGRYGINTAIVFIFVILIAIILNITLYVSSNKPNPAGWLRIDTTATKQFLLEEQVVNTLENIREPIKITAFFERDTSAGAAAWRDTEDMLSEFKRRSSIYDLSYEVLDPELNPNDAISLGVSKFPALAVQGTESLRTEVIEGGNPNISPNVFTEQDLVTAILIINQMKQKLVVFITGHSERDVTDIISPDNIGLAGLSLLRENYAVDNWTLQELQTVLNFGSPEDRPAAIVFANPTQDLLAIDKEALLQYTRTGGGILLSLEPDVIPESFKQYLSRFAVSVGVGEVVDVASFVAPNPTFVQVKSSNSQLPPHPITDDFDVLYLPGSTHFGWSIDPQTIPLDDNENPIIQQAILASSTISSWSELDKELIEFDVNSEMPGPLPLSVIVDINGELPNRAYSSSENSTSSIVLVGDTDFFSNNYLESANNSDLFVNTINYLAKDFELISIRSKTDSNRQMFLTKNERDFIRWSGWLLMPTIIGLYGVWKWWRRR
ncbi:MAG: GldG family protein [Dehalococcoidia bacterium]